MVMGSPIVFPNYKIPFLIGDVGMDICDAVDSSALKQYLIYDKKFFYGSCEGLIKKIASVWYSGDASATFVRNDTLYRYILWLVQKKDI